MKKLLICLMLFFSNTLWANLRLDVNMEYRKGIDKNLVLVNELHSQEKLDRYSEIELNMNNGVKLILQANFIEDKNTFGPSKLVHIYGRVEAKGISLYNKPIEINEIIALGEKREVEHRDEEQLLHITILPVLY